MILSFVFQPFWRVWNAAGSDGRGVIGVLEANFVEPAHDKQGFERTTALSRLEARLIHLQKNYWFVLFLQIVLDVIYKRTTSSE